MHILNLVRNFDRSLKYPQCIQLFSTQKITRIKFYICMYKTEICQVHQYKSIIYDEKKAQESHHQSVNHLRLKQFFVLKKE